MSLPRLFYRLPELAEKWKKTEDDLLHMAAAGSLELSVNHIGTAFTCDELEEVEIRGYVQLDKSFSKHILDYGIGRGYSTMFASWKGGRLFAEDLGKVEGLPVRPFRIFDITDLIILSAEVDKTEKLFPELLNPQINQDQAFQQPETNDEKDPYVFIDDQFCKKHNCSMTTVRNRKKAAGITFELDPANGKRRLRKSISEEMMEKK